MTSQIDASTSINGQDRLSILDGIINGVFAGETRRLKQAFGLIQNQQCALSGKNLKGFLYKGNFCYDPNDVRKRAPLGEREVLHPDLIDQFETYKKDSYQVHSDRAEIRQILALVIEPCETLQDVYDALPNCVLSHFPFHFQKTRPEAYTLSNPRQINQFNEMVEKLMFYSATNIIF